jgi:hypothetical protein
MTSSLKAHLIVSVERRNGDVLAIAEKANGDETDDVALRIAGDLESKS